VRQATLCIRSLSFTLREREAFRHGGSDCRAAPRPRVFPQSGSVPARSRWRQLVDLHGSAAGPGRACPGGVRHGLGRRRNCSGSGEGGSRGSVGTAVSCRPTDWICCRRTLRRLGGWAQAVGDGEARQTRPGAASEWFGTGRGKAGAECGRCCAARAITDRASDWLCRVRGPRTEVRSRAATEAALWLLGSGSAGVGTQEQSSGRRCVAARVARRRLGGLRGGRIGGAGARTERAHRA